MQIQGQERGSKCYFRMKKMKNIKSMKNGGSGFVIVFFLFLIFIIGIVLYSINKTKPLDVLGETNVSQQQTCPGGYSIQNNICVDIKNATKDSIAIDTFSAIMKEKYSNSWSGVVNGTIRFYDSATDPKSATASNIDTITVASGAGSSTAKKIKTETPYRMVYDGIGSYYDRDYGIVTFAVKDYNKNIGQYLYDFGEIIDIASIVDWKEGNSTINGQTNSSTATGGEIVANGDDVITYDISAGNNESYFDYPIEFSGSNSEVKEPVLCFEWDTSNQPEGNEITSLTTYLKEGMNFNIPQDLTNYWSKQECVSLGSIIRGGTYSLYRFTMKVDDGKLSNDDWYLYVDDLGGIKAKDVRLNTGAVYNRHKFNSQA